MQVAGAKTTIAALALTLVAAAGCGRDSDWRNPAVTQAAESRAEAAYLAPPSVTAVSRAGGSVTLRGAAVAGARVRLGAPTGEAHFAQADKDGAWSVTAPDSKTVQLYGLSMTVAERTVQAEGYIALLPGGQVVRLQAGAGAAPLGPTAGRLRILAIDYDRDGGAMVSGIANPGANLVLRIDGLDAPGLADALGRFSIAASQPLSPGTHQILVGGDGEAVATVDASRAEPLGAAPMRALRTPLGWRIDWMTPGGGVQTTLLPAT
jgi:hypothetical protein